ncbi:hypothetical protein EVAR_24895_1 [Eumeta japonica]|uniref:Uncharacterized protein n=1 Tax=Eumeta variegata TaxID=151549 RepID=A0A4C1V5B6_EUMVA|nr:hypothetical protein EVAR_24895_1 [Eumeta japonica]
MDTFNARGVPNALSASREGIGYLIYGGEGEALTHWTKYNGGSSYFTSVLRESVLSPVEPARFCAAAESGKVRMVLPQIQMKNEESKLIQNRRG